MSLTGPALLVALDGPQSLPAPSAAAGALHLLNNTSGAPITITSSGSAPFTVDGANVASLPIAPGAQRRVHSDGAHWIVVPEALSAGAGYAAIATSGLTGDALFVWPLGRFTALPVVTLAYQGAASTDDVDLRITSLTLLGATVRVRANPNPGGQGSALAGAKVHLHALPAG